MSTTTAAEMDSRSSSPVTPDASDVPGNVTIHSELPSWYHPLPISKNIEIWDGDPCQKLDNERMLQLDDIIQEHAYDDSVRSSAENSHSPSDAAKPELSSLEPLLTSLRRSVHESGLSIPSLSQMHSTPIVPPPAVRTCKRDPASIPRKVVCPPKESCYNLAILTPNIPESGTKSRVETQVRVTVDLAHASTSTGEQTQYDRVGSWKWLKLPPGTSTKRRTRREGKIDPAQADILHLTASVTCASAPHNRVLSCGSCRNREAKRVARKLAARVRPARSDSDTPEDGCERPRSVKEDTTSIIQFNCPDVLDFSTGSAVLPVRITCYCRHHREKVGFNIHFTMLDNNGRLVGTGTTPPIMITDDHKSTVKSGTVSSAPTLETQVDWSSFPPPTDNTPLLKYVSRNGKGRPKARSKPYDAAGRSNQSRFSREASVTSLSSSVNSLSVPPYTAPNTRSPTPPQLPQSSCPVSNPQPSTASIMDGELLSAFNSSEPVSTSHNNIPGNTIFSPPNGISTTTTTSHFPSPSDIFSPNTPPGTQPSQLLTTFVPPQPMPFLFFNPGSPPPVSSLPLPKIHRLIPSSGPTHGGIEVTVLGENFHPAVQFNCVFGDVVASSTQRWSDNTLLCVLPPRSGPGVVAVWFEGLDETKNSTLPSLFTYTDESDRALMELALQVVGLKMTGKIEDAKNIALRIVGSTGTEDSPSASNSSSTDVMQVASTSFQDIQPLLFLRLGERHNYEAAVIKFLSLIDVTVENHSGIPLADAVSHTTSSGQTLLHLAVFLKFTSLTEFLIAHCIDLDARDRNGYTALHFAVLVQSKECARLLVAAGADLEIVDALGKTPRDIALTEFFEGITHQVTLEDELSYGSIEDEDGESHLGDVESDEEATIIIKRKHTRGIRRRPHRSRDSHEQPERESPQVSEPAKTPDKTEDITKQKLDATCDEKQAASFVALIQRTLAQIPAPQGIIPTIPQLPLPHLPEMPTVPWAALPQIPMVFPVFIPMSSWSSFLGDKRDAQRDEVPSSKEGDSRATGYSTAQELRATWEKWIAVAVATATLRAPVADEAPPMYTPRESEETAGQQAATDKMELQERTAESTVPQTLDRASRRVGYEVTSTPTADADGYEYIPVKAHSRTGKKHDRMLVLFWLPILLLSLLWAFHSCIRFAIHVLKTSLTTKVGLRA